MGNPGGGWLGLSCLGFSSPHHDLPHVSSCRRQRVDGFAQRRRGRCSSMGDEFRTKFLLAGLQNGLQSLGLQKANKKTFPNSLSGKAL